MNLKAVAREPLLHFMLIGLLVFLVYGKVAPPRDAGQRIVITQALMNQLVQQFQATWSRPPTAGEMRLLQDAYVRDEVFYREGIALGLEKNDSVIKRRLRQKMEVLVEEEGDDSAPSDAELAAYLASHPGKFRQLPVLSFEQALFSPGSYGDRLPQALATGLSALNKGAPVNRQGSPTLLPHRVERQSLDIVARDFGQAFGDALAVAPVGQWTGPVRSSYGMHLVRVSERLEGRLPALAEVRQDVSREWESDRRKAALEAGYTRMKGNYEIVVEPGADAAATP